MDHLSKEHRSCLMKRIRSKDTKPEIVIRSMLHRVGFRFSLRRKDLPGKPDIVLPKYGAVIFVNGCYWHRHNPNLCSKPKPNPKTNSEFWTKKFRLNVQRDEKNTFLLKKMGWRVFTVWECDIQTNLFETFVQLVSKILNKKPDKVCADTFHSKKILKMADKRHRKNLKIKTGSDTFER